MERVLLNSKDFPKLREWAREDHDIYSFVNSCKKAGFKTVNYEFVPKDYSSDFYQYSMSAEEYTWFIVRFG